MPHHPFLGEPPTTPWVLPAAHRVAATAHGRLALLLERCSGPNLNNSLGMMSGRRPLVTFRCDRNATTVRLVLRDLLLFSIMIKYLSRNCSPRGSGMRCRLYS